MASLHTEQLEYLLTHLAQDAPRTVALGVFPADCLPPSSIKTRRGTDTCFVLNTDPHGAPGAHWLAFYYDDEKRVLEYFDSFGLPLTTYRTVAHTLSTCRISVRAANAEDMLQSPGTTACGYYCILFLHYRTRFGSCAAAVSKLRKLGTSVWGSHNRDTHVVREMHKLMHSHRCRALPTVRCRFSQDCKCYSALRS